MTDKLPIVPGQLVQPQRCVLCGTVILQAGVLPRLWVDGLALCWACGKLYTYSPDLWWLGCPAETEGVREPITEVYVMPRKPRPDLNFDLCKHDTPDQRRHQVAGLAAVSTGDMLIVLSSLHLYYAGKVS